MQQSLVISLSFRKFCGSFLCSDSLNYSFSGLVNSCFCIASLAGEGREAGLVRAGSSFPKVAGGRNKNYQHCVVLCV